MTNINYTPILTEASYVHAKQAMPYTLELLSTLPFVPVSTTTGTIIKPNLDEQRRNDVTGDPYGTRIESRISDTSTIAYTTASFNDGERLLGVEGINVGGLTSVTAQEHMLNLATVTAERSAFKLIKGFANEFMNASNYGSGSKTDPTDWTTATTDLVKQITDKVDEVQKISGADPDTIIVTKDVHAIIRNNVNVLDALAGFGASTSQGSELGAYRLGLNNFARVFGVQNYFVLDGSYNGAGIRATASNAWLDTRKLLIACLGQNLSLNGSTIQNYGGLGVCPYVNMTSLSSAEFRIGNGGNTLPFPIVTRTTFNPEIAGGGEHRIISEVLAGFKIIEPLYGHLIYNAIA
jgi:hypothetical protein